MAPRVNTDSDDELLKLLESGGMVEVAYFDAAKISLRCEDVPVAEALPALKNFLKLTAKQRRADGRHLLAYCKLMIEVVGEESVLGDLGGVLPTVDEIWNYARPLGISFSALDPGKYAFERTIYVNVEGEVDWEPEHGLQMVWEGGARLVKVSEYDGHPTNGHASAKPERDQFVFSCFIPELCTQRDPN